DLVVFISSFAEYARGRNPRTPRGVRRTPLPPPGGQTPWPNTAKPTPPYGETPMNVFTVMEPPYWWRPQKRTRRGHPTRSRRNPRRPPWPEDWTRPGDR